MVRKASSNWCLAFLAVVICILCIQTIVNAQVQDLASNWLNPQNATLKQTTSQTGPQNEPYFFENLDCYLVDYRQSATNTTKTGCFTNTDYGMVDTDSYTVIFNGTDEGQSLTPYSDRDSIVPWPNATALINLSAASTGGAYLAMYKNPLATMSDKRNLLAQITGKQITSFPDVLFTDSAGKRLVINPKALAFSSDGSWMVAETTYGSFVRVNVVTNSVLAFAPSFTRSGFTGLLDSQVAISDSGRFVAISNNSSQSFKIYDLDTCSSSIMETKGNFCDSYDYRPRINSFIGNIMAIKHVRFTNSELLSFSVQSSVPGKSGTYLLSPNTINNYLEYLALGDSYTSGEGAFDYLSGTDSAVNHCHLSAKSYPLLIKKDLFSNDSAHSVACSGAHINDVTSRDGRYVGQVENIANYDNLATNNPELLNAVKTNFLPGYIAQNKFAADYQPRIITVSVGGNDVGFGDILESCAVPKVTLHQSSNVCFNTYEDRLEILNLVDETYKKWKALFEQLKSQSPKSTIYAIGYPIMVSGQGSCGLNVHLNKNEIEFINEMVVYINNSMSSAATKAGIEFVDVESAFSGSKLCEGNSTDIAMNGLTAGKDDGILGLKVYGSESYHPNARGQELLAQTILGQTANFKSAFKKSTTDNKISILNAPKSGREVYRKKPSKITSKTIKKGGKAGVKSKGSRSGTKPKSSYQIKLGGPSGQLIDTLQSDENGDVNTSVSIPSDSSSGSTTIDIVGPGQGNDKIDITQPVYISDNDDDIDSDGILNNNDSCPLAANSLIDQDNDGIDDVCDSYLGTTSSSGSTNNSQQPTAALSTPISIAPTPTNAGNNSAVEVAKLTVIKPKIAKDLTVSRPTATSLAATRSGALGSISSAPEPERYPKSVRVKRYQNLPLPKISLWNILILYFVFWIFIYKIIMAKNKKHDAHRQILLMSKKPSA